MGANEALKAEYGLEEDPMILTWIKLAPIALELALPGVLRWMQRLQPHVLVFCPMLNRDAYFAAKTLGIPCVPLLTTAGPGSLVPVVSQFLSWSGLSMPEAIDRARRFSPTAKAVQNLRDLYGINYDAELDLSAKIPGSIGCLMRSPLTIVTTCEDMKDPAPADMEAAYSSAGANFVYVGPLLDEQGARRAAGHRFAQFKASGSSGLTPCGEAVQELMRAREAGRLIVLASMGTVITGDSPDWGWAVKPVESQRQGLTGKQLCQAAWSGVFQAFGAQEGDNVEQAPLILLSMGPQKDALEGLQVPRNALCMPVLPQVDLLRAGVDIFLTHGGQDPSAFSNIFAPKKAQGP